MNKTAESTSKARAPLHIPPRSIVLQRSVVFYRNLKGAIFPERASESGLSNAADMLREGIFDFCNTYGGKIPLKAFEYKESVAELLKKGLGQSAQKKRDPALFFTLPNVPLSTEEGVHLERARLISINEDRVFAILNAEDHLTLTAICPDDCFRDVFFTLKTIERSLDKRTPFAFNRTFGFLSPNLDHCGTGMLLSAHVKLVGLSLTRKLDAVFRALEAVGLTITPVFSRDCLIERVFAGRPLAGSPVEAAASDKDAPQPDDDFGGIDAPGYIYRLDYDHEAACIEGQLSHMEAVLAELERQEHKARCMLLNNETHPLLDYVRRSYAIGTHALQLYKSEAIDILSTMVLAAQYGLFAISKRKLLDLEVAFHEMVRTPTFYRPEDTPPSDDAPDNDTAVARARNMRAFCIHNVLSRFA
ncbi:MAG: hypothetical protein ACI4QT_00255 [Kiritimatiellia bacterium]